VRKDLPGHRVTPRLSTSRRPQGDFIPELFRGWHPLDDVRAFPTLKGIEGQAMSWQYATGGMGEVAPGV